MAQVEPNEHCHLLPLHMQQRDTRTADRTVSNPSSTELQAPAAMYELTLL